MVPDHSPSTEERASLAQPSQSSSPLECTSHLGFSLGRHVRGCYAAAIAADIEDDYTVECTFVLLSEGLPERRNRNVEEGFEDDIRSFEFDEVKAHGESMGVRVERL